MARVKKVQSDFLEPLHMKELLKSVNTGFILSQFLATELLSHCNLIHEIKDESYLTS